MSRKGRFTEDQVRDILKAKGTCIQIAKRFNTSYEIIYSIKHRTSYSWVKGTLVPPIKGCNARTPSKPTESNPGFPTQKSVDDFIDSRYADHLKEQEEKKVKDEPAREKLSTEQQVNDLKKESELLAWQIKVAQKKSTLKFWSEQ